MTDLFEEHWPTLLSDEDGTEAFLSRSTVTAFATAVLSTMVSAMFILADRAPEVIDDNARSDGYEIANSNPLPEPVFLWIYTFLTLFIVVSVSKYLYEKTESAVLSGASGSIMSGILLLILPAIPFSPIHLCGRGIFDIPPNLPLFGLLCTSLLTGALVFVYCRPLVPDIERTAAPRFMANQWRYAQTVLSAAVTGVIGISIPFMLSFSSIRVLGLMSSLVVLLTVPASIVGFIMYRLHRLEVEIR